jgi:hypothetical protein
LLIGSEAVSGADQVPEIVREDERTTDRRLRIATQATVARPGLDGDVCIEGELAGRGEVLRSTPGAARRPNGCLDDAVASVRAMPHGDRVTKQVDRELGRLRRGSRDREARGGAPVTAGRARRRPDRRFLGGELPPDGNDVPGAIRADSRRRRGDVWRRDRVGFQLRPRCVGENQKDGH